MTTVLYDFCIMSAVLLFAKIIRVKISTIQKLYIPSALLAGFIGLIFGPNGLKLLPFSSEFGNYSSILIAILFGSMVFGNKTKASFKEMVSRVGETFFVNCSAEVFQYGFFMLIGTTILPLLFSEIHEGFGLMLTAGFIGGHGTAAAIGGVFSDNGWFEATSIGQTFATVGLLVGILGGVLIINIAARKGVTKAIKSVKDLPEEMLIGLIPEEKRQTTGAETTSSMSIDTMTWHLGLVLTSVGAAYLVNLELKILLPSVSFPTYGLALICSVFVQIILKLCRMDNYVDKKTIIHIGSCSTDFLVAFGVASIDLNIVLQYWMQIVLLAIMGIVVVVFYLIVIARKFFSNYWFERGIYIYGMSTGVLATGAILLRIADPEFRTGVLEDFGFAWIFMSGIDMLLVSLCPMLILGGIGAVAGTILIAVAIGCLIICKLMFRRYKGP